MRISLVISSLRSGGAERALVLLAKGLVAQGHDISVITVTDRSTDFYRLPELVSRRTLFDGQTASVVSAAKRKVTKIPRLRRAILASKPDVVIAFITQTNVEVITALAGTGIRTLISEQVDPIEMRRGPALATLRRITYPLAAQTVSASAGIEDYFHWIPADRRCVIHNPVDVEEIKQLRAEQISPALAPLDRPYIAAMGRLVDQKGFDYLIQAFQSVRQAHPNWSLVILGEGEKRPILEAMIRERDLSDAIVLPGRLENPFALIQRAEMFVLSSRFEGFGNVVVEAMACGAPVVSFDCPSGPGEIIAHQVNGVLVPPKDVSALTSAILDLIADPAKRRRLANAGAARALDFDVPRIAEQWSSLLNALRSRAA